MKTSLLFAGLFVVGILLLPEQVASQKCNCAPNECCSKFGYCGTTNDFCGKDCRSGPCSLPALYNGVNRADIVTTGFFYGIMAKAGNNCPGKSFYARNMFLTAIRDYQEFARSGSYDDSKREIAAFFAHVTHETGHFCYIEEIDGRSKNYCDRSSTRYPCAPNKGYYGRGPLQISWNYNYGAAGESIGFDGLRNPEIVATDPLISFKTALWFWMENVHSGFTSSYEFGPTIRAINSGECNGGSADSVTSRVMYYTEYCRQFGVSTGGNLRC